MPASDGRQLRLGTRVNGYGVSELVQAVAAAPEDEVEQLVAAYEASYTLSPSLRAGGDQRPALREAARIEVGLRAFLEAGGFGAFTDTFEDLGGLVQLPGIAVQRLMAEGYGFGAEGDWKTAVLVRVMKTMAAGLPGGSSFMEDYTYHFGSSPAQVLGAHMLEVCPSIAAATPSCEIHPLGIGGKEDPVRLVFVDECGTHTSLTRRRARAARGRRARGAVPRNRGPVTTLLAGVSLAGMRPAMTVEGGTDTAVFATYLEHFLLPALSPGMVIVVDNLGAHKPDRIRALVEAAGCELVFLPAYSPDLSPIEEAFSKLKALIRAAGARTRAALDAAIAAALDAVTPADADGWFTHAGYRTLQAA